MPSRLHAVYARLVPRVRRAGEMVGDEPAERARVEEWHATLDRTLPTSAVPRFARKWSVVIEEVAGFPTYVISPRHRVPTRTLFYLHGGGFMAPISAWQVRYVVRLADAIGARVVLPDYPLAPEHSWRDSFKPVADLAARWAAEPGGIVLAGDSSGGGYALAIALALRDRRRRAADPPRAARAVDRPDDEHAGDGRVRRGRPVALQGQDARVRAVVGGLARGPRPSRGESRAGGPARSPPGADVLRHPRPARARLPPARPPGGRGRLGPHRRRGARAHPRLPTPPVPPGGEGGVRPDGRS